MTEELIKRSDAIKAVEECLKLLARPRYTVKTAIEAIPSVDIPLEKCEYCEYRYARYVGVCDMCELIGDEPQTERSNDAE